MSEDVNDLTIIGHAGKEPNRLTDNMVVFQVCTERRWANKDGVKESKPQWHNITCYGKMAEIAEDRVYSGCLIYIKGEMDYTKKGDKHYSSVIPHKMRVLSQNYNQVTEEDYHAQQQDRYAKRHGE